MFSKHGDHFLFGISKFHCSFKKRGAAISDKYLQVAAVLVSGKEAYGCQKQALTISLTLKTMKVGDFRLL